MFKNLEPCAFFHYIARLNFTIQGKGCVFLIMSLESMLYGSPKGHNLSILQYFFD